MYLNLTVKHIWNLIFFKGVDMYKGRNRFGVRQHCDKYNFSVAGNTFFSLGEITVCQEGFNTSVLMKEKCGECVKSHSTATILLNFFRYVVGLCLIIGSYFSILL